MEAHGFGCCGNTLDSHLVITNDMILDTMKCRDFLALAFQVRLLGFPFQYDP